MKRVLCVLAVAMFVLSATVARSADRVKAGGKTQMGKITEMSSTAVTMDQKKFPVNEIELVSFDEEPKGLRDGRNQYVAGKYQEALEKFNSVDLADVSRPEVKQDVEFFKAMCAARMALYGSHEEKELKAAGQQLLTFIKNTGNFHYYEACETLGDILAAMGLASSEKYYNLVATAPWPDYRLRATVLSGRALTSQKEYDKAIKKFDEVIGQKDSEPQRLAATLGKATAMAGKGKVEDAIKLLNEVVEKADAENVEVHARAFTARGNCYMMAATRPPEEVGGRSAMDNKQHALVDFLKVDMLYSSYPEQHAEALAKLVGLFKDMNRGRRAEEKRSELLKTYPNSSWAAKLGG